MAIVFRLPEFDANGLLDVGDWTNARTASKHIVNSDGSLIEIGAGVFHYPGAKYVGSGTSFDIYNKDGSTELDTYLLHEPAATNYFLLSLTPTTQAVSPPAGDYVVSVYGSGSVTLSGDATGIVTQGNPVTFTGTGGAVLCTVSGSLDGVQVEEGATPTSLIETGFSVETRDSDEIRHPLTDWSNDDGMLYFRGEILNSDLATKFSNKHIAGPVTSYLTTLYSGSNTSIGSYDNTTDANSSVASGDTIGVNEEFSSAACWNDSIGQGEVTPGYLTVGYSISSEWSWGSAAHYNLYTLGSYLYVLYGNPNIVKISVVDVFDACAGQSWIEAYEPIPEPTPEPTPESPTGGGISKRQRKKFANIDGKLYQVASFREAKALFEHFNKGKVKPKQKRVRLKTSGKYVSIISKPGEIISDDKIRATLEAQQEEEALLLMVLGEL